MTEENSKMAVPGLLMRLTQSSSHAHRSPQTPCPNILQVWTAIADDGKAPHQLTLYHLSDVRPLLSSSDLYDSDVLSHGEETSLAWVVCSFINGRSKDETKTSSTHLLSHSPAEGSKLVINGSSPRPDKEHDYHGWYNEEHGPMLSLVPGWNENQRYRLEKNYGDVETASFYGFNYYDEENGLGGPEWKASTNTEWTQRVRNNHEKPNIRRVWKIEHT
ncbi:hypothetical protein Q7P35_001240 [Cladosporium inversicolor]